MIPTPAGRYKAPDHRIRRGTPDRRRADSAPTPAGHVPGSAQIRVEVGGEVWVVSGDYKTVDDGLSTPFEPVRCHTFISESTFGHADLQLDAAGRAGARAQHLVGRDRRLRPACRPRGLRAGQGAAHPAAAGPVERSDPDPCAVEATTAVLRAQGLDLPETIQITRETDLKSLFRRDGPRPALRPRLRVDAPPRSGLHRLRFGWMRLRGVRRRRAADRGFVVSDHADWRTG